jgi:hypothetical protein
MTGCVAQQNSAPPLPGGVSRHHHQFPLDLPPAVLKLLALLLLPIRPDILGKLRPRVKVSPGEIQNEWPLDDGHFEDAQPVIRTDQLGHVEAQDGAHRRAFQALIYPPFSLVRLRPAKRLDRYFSSLGLALANQYDTVLSRAQRLGQVKLMPLSIPAKVEDQDFVHDCGT